MAKQPALPKPKAKFKAHLDAVLNGEGKLAINRYGLIRALEVCS